MILVIFLPPSSDVAKAPCIVPPMSEPTFRTIVMSFEFLYVGANLRFADDKFFVTAGDQGRLRHSM